MKVVGGGGGGRKICKLETNTVNGLGSGGKLHDMTGKWER